MTNQTQQDKFIYLPIYLSDWVSDSRKLTMIQRGALIDLSVLYFQENLQLKYSKEQLYRLVFAFEKQEQEAVDFILENYFIKSKNKPTGFYWVSIKLNELGDRILKRLNASRKNGKKGGRKNKRLEEPMGLKTDNLDESILNEIKLNQIKSKETNQIKSNENKELKETEKDFETFWNFYTPVCAKDGTYTNKGNKQKAFISYKKARKKFEHDKIMTCLKLYLEDCQKRGGYTMHAVRWLNDAMEDDFKYEQVTPIQPQIKPTFPTREQKDQEMYDNFLNGKN